MPIYRGTQPGASLAAGASFKPDLKPNDRFGPRGGHVRIRAAEANGDAATSAVAETVFIGNEMVENRGQVSRDSTTQPGISNFTPAVEAVGGPGEVIDVTYFSTGTTAAVFQWVIEIENA